MQTYRIVRHYENGKKRVLKRDVTLSEAQVHCNDPETSSFSETRRSATTRRNGRWFDGYERERK